MKFDEKILLFSWTHLNFNVFSKIIVILGRYGFISCINPKVKPMAVISKNNNKLRIGLKIICLYLITVRIQRIANT
jgi:hypothetical protein